MIDTAGLDEKLAARPENIVEKKSQEKTARILEQAGLVLLVLDNSQPIDQLDRRLIEKITGKLVLSEAEGKILTVLNKSDLPAKLNAAKLPKILANKVRISAKLGTGIENLLRKIRQICG
ncbi:unnamed protein product, partial [marine sediment metagenome]